MRGRKSLIYKQGKIDESEFRYYALDLLVDENGNKRSIRNLFDDPEFQDVTGFWRINKKTGERESISPGSIAHQIKKFNLYEEEIFEYHKYVTRRIPYNMDIEQFRSRNIKLYIEDFENYNVKSAIRKILNEIGSPITPNQYSDFEVIWMGLRDDKHFRYDLNKLYKMFNEFYKG